MSNVIEITAENFEDTVLKSAKPFLVDFWADWCGPCRAVGPVVDEIAAEMADSLSVGKLNVDEQPTLAQKYNVMSIPTLLLFKDGQVVVNSLGAVPKAELLKRLAPGLDGGQVATTA